MEWNEHRCKKMPEDVQVSYAMTSDPYVIFETESDSPYGFTFSFDAIYCPWCGKNLVAEKREWKKQFNTNHEGSRNETQRRA